MNQSSGCRGGNGCCIEVRVVFLFCSFSFVLIYVSQPLIITHVARFLHRSGCNLIIVSWDIPHAALLQLLACKDPPCDAVEAQEISQVS